MSYKLKVFPLKDVPFEGHDGTAVYLGGQIPPQKNPYFMGLNKHFQAKLVNY